MTLLLILLTTLSTMIHKDKPVNIFGEKLESCCTDPMTGYYRDGYCNTSADDYGTHVICAVMTQEFLDYTVKMGNDLCTAKPEYHFPGLKAGDGWCLCAIRWKEAYDAGVAPLVRLESTHIKALKYVKMEELVKYAVKSKTPKK